MERKKEKGYAVLEYLYRDAGNWKTHGAVLLSGKVRDSGAAIRSCLEQGEFFVPEQVLLPALHQQHWRDHEDGPNDLDHAFHEFTVLRDAREEDLLSLSPCGSLVRLVSRFVAAQGRWDVRCSRYIE
ncbi:hypothetical protein D3C81_734810 [compost metagenome]